MQIRILSPRTRASVLISGVLALSLSACSTGDEGSSTTAGSAADTAATTSSQAASVQVAQLNRTRTTTTTTTTTTPSTTSGTLNTVEEVIGDMKLASDRLPIAPAGWGALLGTELMLVDPGPEFQTGLPWGVVFEGVGGNTATNTRVQIRNIRYYVKRRSTGQWELISSAPSVGGQDFSDLSSEYGTRPGDVRSEPDGGISVRTGGGFCFHFWTTAGRARVPSGDIAGAFVTYQMRAILHNASAADDRDASNYVAYAGLDYWRSETATFLPDYSNNPGSGHGRFKRATQNWRPVNFVTIQGSVVTTLAPDYKTPMPQQFAPYALTEAQVRADAPPLE